MEAGGGFLGLARASHDRASVLPAALAAIGEAGPLSLVVTSLAADSSGITGGPMVSYPLFLACFVGAVAVATAFRRDPLTRVAVPAVAVVGGVLEGLLGGAGDMSAVIAGLLVAAGVALRVVTLAVRDWRAPVAGSFGVWAVVLLAEMGLAPSDRFDHLLPIIVLLFFVGTMASRAASVWLDNRPPPGVDVPPVAGRLRNPAVLIGLLTGVLCLAFLLAIPGGAFQISGGFIYGMVAQALALSGLVLARIMLPPLGWFVEKLHISLQPIRDAAETLSRIKGVSNDPTGRTFAVERLLGVVFLLVMGFLLFRAIRRRWKLLQPTPEEEDGDAAMPEPTRMVLPHRMRSRRRGLRRELPVQTVRRWYAEALIALERLGLQKPPSTTPGEYLREVTGEFPACAVGFTALTRAYEDVRYGAGTVGGDALDRLEVHREMAMTALRSARSVQEREEEEGSSDPDRP